MKYQIYGQEWLGYKQLPTEEINKKAFELERVVQLWCEKYNKALQGSVYLEMTETVANLLRPYTSSQKVRQTIIDSLSTDVVKDLIIQLPNYITTRTIFRVLAPWRKIHPDVDEALQKANPNKNVINNVYESVPPYYQITGDDLRKFYSDAPERQKGLFTFRAPDIVTSQPKALNALLMIAFSPNSQHNEEVINTAQQTFLYLINKDLTKGLTTPELDSQKIPEDRFFNLRVARGIEGICKAGELKLQDDFMEGLMIYLYQEEWLKAAEIIRVT